MRISIHAPREGSDLFLIHCRRSIAISIHAPREGSDRRTGTKRKLSFYFNPRSPWRERLNGEKIAKYNSDFNPRSPWRERLRNLTSVRRWSDISIHAPREGSDMIIWIYVYIFYNFNPRSPWRERQQCWLIFLLQSFNFLLILLIFLYNYKSITLSISYST